MEAIEQAAQGEGELHLASRWFCYPKKEEKKIFYT